MPLVLILKKEFIGPGLHLRPVHADHAQPPFQWTLNSVFSAYENNNQRIRPPPDRGTLNHSTVYSSHLSALVRSVPLLSFIVSLFVFYCILHIVEVIIT